LRYIPRRTTVIVEYIRYQVPAGREPELERAYAAAARQLDASPHCLAYEVSRCAEDAGSVIVRIEWDSAEGHLQGFRRSPEFRDFYGAVAAFVDSIQEMRHYERRLSSGAAPAAA
jgi:heme-degrading monooxygenase HmoA